MLASILDRTAALVSAAKVNRDYDIPYLSNRSVDGKTVYIDRRVPETVANGIRTHETLPWHELSEWAAENDGLPYQEAHRQVANPVERWRVESLGGNWSAYQAELAPLIREVGHEDIKSVPPDLDMRPYEDEHDRAVMAQLAAASVAKTARIDVDNFNFFVPLSKVEMQPDGSRLISGYASTPTRDLDGEIVSLDAIKNALPGYWTWRAIREMHAPKAVGRAQEANVDADGLFLTAKIVDPNCVKLIDEKVLQGFSIGGKKLAKKGDIITELELIEISVVDRPSNPDCAFEVVGKRASHAGELVKPPAPAETGDLVIAEAEIGPLRKFFARLFGKGGDAPGEGDKPYGESDTAGYADPGWQKDGKKRYPLKENGQLNEAKIRAAWNYIHKPKNAGKYSPEHLASIKAKIVAAWKKKIDAAGPPGAASKAAMVAELRKYDGNEVLDSQSALHAIQILHDLLQWEGEEDEGEDGQIAAIKTAIEALKNFVSSEIKEKPEDGEGEPAAKAATADRSPFDEIKEHLKMAGLEEVLARFASGNAANGSGNGNAANIAKRTNAGHMAKAAHHLGKAMECAKAAHGHFGKCAGSMMSHMKAMKAADGGAADHLTAALGHMAAGNAKMEEMSDHHDLAQHWLGKAGTAGTSGTGGGTSADESGPGGNVGGGSSDIDQGKLTEGGVPMYDPMSAYPGKAAGYSKEVVDQLIAATKAAALAEGKLEIMSRMPAGPSQVRRFGSIDKAFGAGGGLDQGHADARSVLYKGVNLDPRDQTEAVDASAQMLNNMYENPHLFAKKVTDPTFRGGAGIKRQASR